ncbi:MAG: GNAT family N-acetyltransferase [Alteromonadaceae bacterium]|nr:GNAT family N-acetyltransferase [Alteromonadaceae bacterium]
MKANTTIRSAQATDGKALIELFKLHAQHEGHKLIINNKQLHALTNNHTHPLILFVVEHNGLVEGYMSLIKQFSTWDMDYYLYLDCLFLKTSLRGMNIGKQMMATAAELSKSLGLKQIQWQTPHDNNNAIAFYQKMGATGKQKLRFFW